MTSTLRRWQLACGLLAAITAYSWQREPVPSSKPAASAASRSGYRGQLRVDPSSLGVSASELVEQLLASRDITEMRGIADRLAAIGSEDVIEPLLPLIDDDREGVADVVIVLFGKLGGDQAVTKLVELAEDPRYDIAESAILALGHTTSARAETFLISLVDGGSVAALTALATLGTDTAVAVLEETAMLRAEDQQRVAFEALGQLRTPAAQAALRALMDSPSVMTATRAIETLQDIDDETLAKLSAIVKSGDAELGKSAVAALGRAGEAAGAVLAEVARNGVPDLRVIAVRALGGIRSTLAFDTLAEVVESDEGDVALAALGALGHLDSADSREILISVAMSDRSIAPAAVAELTALSGPEVEAALLVIAKTDNESAFTALTYLLGRQHEDALALVVARARTGDDELRYRAFDMLASAGTAAALTQLVDLMRGEHGEFKGRLIRMLVAKRPGDAMLGELLRDSVRSTDMEEASAAALALGAAGTPEARDALLAALSSSDSDLVYTVVRALDSYRLDDSAAAALVRAAESHEGVTEIVMRKLLAVGSPHGVRLAETALHSSEPYVAARAIDMLRTVGNKAAFQLIEDAVHTTEGDVRSAAVRAIADSRDPRVVDILTNALDDPSPDVRSTVAYALRQVGGDKARDALLRMTRSADAGDRVAAVQSMRDLSDKPTLQRMNELLRDPDNRVAQYAMYSLAGNPSGVAMLRTLVVNGGGSHSVRYQAAIALQRYDMLDDRSSEWLAAATRDDYGE